ncbi:methionyl-tRNA formyltransferase [Candidatus Nomurabacteria bacterium]|nr:methionyl-tRNA formyltransferase [Candidatus Nomurabacteria bacterium]
MEENKSKKLNFAFFGTPDVASETLEILKQGGYLPSLIITSPDKPQGRKMIVTPPPVKVWAKENNILYIQPEKLTKEEIRKDFDLFIVVAYGKIIPENILNMPKWGSINIHYSLLPKYRGASPVESAILNGETETGVTIQEMVYKMDAGPIIAQEKITITPDEKAPELRKRFIKIGGGLLVKTLETPSLRPGSEHSPFAGGEKQDESQATYCQKIKKEDGLLNLVAESPSALYNKFRAYAHWPRTFFFKNGKRIIVTDAALENGRFVIKKVLPEGKKETTWDNFQSTL